VRLVKKKNRCDASFKSKNHASHLFLLFRGSTERLAQHPQMVLPKNIPPCS